MLIPTQTLRDNAIERSTPFNRTIWYDIDKIKLMRRMIPLSIEKNTDDSN